MKIVIVTVFFTLVVFPNYVELAGSKGIHQAPFRPHVHHYELHPGVVLRIPEHPEGFYNVGVENGFIIGLVMEKWLYPLYVYGIGRVKVHLYNNENIPITDFDPLMHRFYKQFEPVNHIFLAELRNE